jgi:hypothetical protein
VLGPFKCDTANSASTADHLTSSGRTNIGTSLDSTANEMALESGIVSSAISRGISTLLHAFAKPDIEGAGTMSLHSEQNTSGFYRDSSTINSYWHCIIPPDLIFYFLNNKKPRVFELPALCPSKWALDLYVLYTLRE